MKIIHYRLDLLIMNLNMVNIIQQLFKKKMYAECGRKLGMLYMQMKLLYYNILNCFTVVVEI